MEALGRLRSQQQHDEALGRLRRPLCPPHSPWPAAGREKRQACAALLTGFRLGVRGARVPLVGAGGVGIAEPGERLRSGGWPWGCRQPAGVVGGCGVGRGGPERLQPEEIRGTQHLQAGRGTRDLDGQPEKEREPPNGGSRQSAGSDVPKRPSKRMRRRWNEPVVAKWGGG